MRKIKKGQIMEDLNIFQRNVYLFQWEMWKRGRFGQKNDIIRCECSMPHLCQRNDNCAIDDKSILAQLWWLVRFSVWFSLVPCLFCRSQHWTDERSYLEVGMAVITILYVLRPLSFHEHIIPTVSCSMIQLGFPQASILS